NEQSASTNFFNRRMVNFTQFAHEIVAQFQRAVSQFLVLQYFHRCNGYCTSKRIAAKCRTVGTRVKDTKNFVVSYNTRNREYASAKCFTEYVHVRVYIFPFTGEHFAGTRKAALNFVRNEQDVVFTAKFSCSFQKSFFLHNDSSFTLDWLNQEC